MKSAEDFWSKKKFADPTTTAAAATMAEEEDRQVDQWLLGRQQRMGELSGDGNAAPALGVVDAAAARGEKRYFVLPKKNENPFRSNTLTSALLLSSHRRFLFFLPDRRCLTSRA